MLSNGVSRCHRLAKACEQPVSIRKRRAHKASSRSAQSPPPRNLLEEKLDNVISLLRSQASTKQPVEQILEVRPGNDDTPSTVRSPDEPIVPSIGRGSEVVIDTTESVVHLFRPTETPNDPPSMAPSPPSPIAGDIPTDTTTEWEAEEQLATFRRAFIPMFPFIHIPNTTSASDLRREKPFVWLIIMVLTTKVVSKQFDLADHVWKIISRRVLCEHHASLDLLLGIICFCSWYEIGFAPKLLKQVLWTDYFRSHHCKKEKPFMTMLTQMAVSMAFELDLHNGTSPRGKPNSLTAHQTSARLDRTMEERRTFAALFHLTSA